MSTQPINDNDDDECIDFRNPHDASSKLFDLRLLIGGLFSLYGLVLIVVSFFLGERERAKAAGININLWLGIGMLALGVLFLIWARTRPLRIGGQSALARAEEGGGPPPGMH